jgi:hypothetical protein
MITGAVVVGFIMLAGIGLAVVTRVSKIDEND